MKALELGVMANSLNCMKLCPSFRCHCVLQSVLNIKWGECMIGREKGPIQQIASRQRNSSWNTQEDDEKGPSHRIVPKTLSRASAFGGVTLPFHNILPRLARSPVAFPTVNVRSSDDRRPLESRKGT
jgi:hypothetical protein